MVRSLIAVAVLIVALPTMAGHGNSTPSGAVLIAPVADSIVYTPAPTLVWHTDSASGTGDSLLYEFHLAKDGEFANCVASGRLADTITGLIDWLEPDLQYTWRVLTRDSTGDAAVSALESFRTYLPGDVNASRTVTSIDIITLVNYVFKGAALEVPECAGNVNGGMIWDLVVNSSDIITLVNYVFKGGDAPRAKCLPAPWTFRRWKPFHGDLVVFASEPQWASPSGDAVSLSIYFESTSYYPNSPNALLIDFDSSGHSLSYRVHGVLEPEIVFGAPGPGYYTTEYTLDTGVYELIFERCDWVDRLQLTLTDSNLALTHLDSQFTHILNPLQWRNP